MWGYIPYIYLLFSKMNRISYWSGDVGDYSPYMPPYHEPHLAEPPGMNEDPKAGCFAMIIGIILAILLLWLLPSCSSSRKALTATSKSVTKTNAIFSRIDTTEAWQRTANENQRVTAVIDYAHDTVIVKSTTIVREADSMELARYGIVLDSLQKAYLILQKDMTERISVSQKSLIDSLSMLRDSLSSLRSRDYSLLALTKSCVEESATEETTRNLSPPLWFFLLLVIISIIFFILYRYF